jgi:hypothetical protein
MDAYCAHTEGLLGLSAELLGHTLAMCAIVDWTSAACACRALRAAVADVRNAYTAADELALGMGSGLEAGSLSAGGDSAPGAAPRPPLRSLLGDLGNLRELRLRWCDAVTDADLAVVGELLPRLQLLDLTGCCHVSNRGVRSVLSGAHPLLTTGSANYLSAHPLLSLICELPCRSSLTFISLVACVGGSGG